MSGIKSMVGQKMSKEVAFMGGKVKISKLSVSEIMEIQNTAKEIQESEDGSLKILMSVIGSAVEDGDELTEADFETFPMDELSKLSAEIMKFSGIDQDRGK